MYKNLKQCQTVYLVEKAVWLKSAQIKHQSNYLLYVFIVIYLYLTQYSFRIFFSQWEYKSYLKITKFFQQPKSSINWWTSSTTKSRTKRLLVKLFAQPDPQFSRENSKMKAVSMELINHAYLKSFLKVGWVTLFSSLYNTFWRRYF